MRSKQLYHRPKNFGRELRVGDFIRVELTELVSRKMRDPRVHEGDVAITDVKVSRDLAYADVFVACHGVADESEAEQTVAVLRHAAGFLRSELAQRHSMRTTPELRFHVDQTEAEANRIDQLLANARQP